MPNGQPRIGIVSAAIVDLWPLRKNAAPACYFFQLLLLARMLIVDETSREASIRGSPNRRGLNSFPSSGSVGDLDRIGLPGGSLLDPQSPLEDCSDPNQAASFPFTLDSRDQLEDR